MKDLVEHIVKALVEHPEGVRVEMVEGARSTVLELRVHPDDLGRAIGREGRNVNAIRMLLGAVGMKLHRRFTLEVIKERQSEG